MIHEAALHDPGLKRIYEAIVSSVPVKSVFLCGSRATGVVASESSDYDLGVVMSTFLVPFFLGRLGRISEALSQELGRQVTINPLPAFRLRRARGHLFLHKLKREAITLYGEECFRWLDTGAARDIEPYWFFSYLFSAIKHLLETFDPGVLRVHLDRQQHNLLSRDAAKAISYCAELYLLRNGYEETGVLFDEKALAGVSTLLGDDPDIVADLWVASAVRRGQANAVAEPVEFWFRARQRCLTAFETLMRDYLGVTEGEPARLAWEYLARTRRVWARNLQYFVLVLLARRETAWRALASPYTIERLCHAGLLWLLLSVRSDGQVDSDYLLRGRDLLRKAMKVGTASTDVGQWREFKRAIFAYWPYACTLMGV